MLLFRQMRENETLPVEIEFVRRTRAFQLQPAAALQRHEQEMHLGVMAQRLIMPDALHGRGDRFPVENAALAERDFQSEPAAAEPFENFQLYLAHKLHADLPGIVVIYDVQERVLLFKNAQLL